MFIGKYNRITIFSDNFIFKKNKSIKILFENRPFTFILKFSFYTEFLLNNQ